MKVQATRRIPSRFYDASVEYWNAISDDDSTVSSLSEIADPYSADDADNHSQESENEFKAYDKFRQACSQRRKTKEELDNCRRHVSVPLESDTDDASMLERYPRKQRRFKAPRPKSTDLVAPVAVPMPTISDIADVDHASRDRPSWTDSGVSLSRTDQSRSGTLYEEPKSQCPAIRASSATSSASDDKDASVRQSALNRHVASFGYAEQEKRLTYGVDNPFSDLDSRLATAGSTRGLVTQLASSFDDMSAPNARTERLLSKISKLLETGSSSDLTSVVTSPSYNSITQASCGSSCKDSSGKRSWSTRSGSSDTAVPGKEVGSGSRSSCDHVEAVVLQSSSTSGDQLRRSSDADKASADRRLSNSRADRFSSQVGNAQADSRITAQKQASSKGLETKFSDSGTSSSNDKLVSRAAQGCKDAGESQPRNAQAESAGDLVEPDDAKGKWQRRKLSEQQKLDKSIAKQKEILLHVMQKARRESSKSTDASPKKSDYPKQTDYTMNRYLANHNQSHGDRQKVSAFLSGIRKVGRAIVKPRFSAHKQPKDCSDEFSFVKVDRPSGQKQMSTKAAKTSVELSETSVGREACLSSSTKALGDDNLPDYNALEKLAHKPTKDGILSRLFGRTRSYSAERLVLRGRGKVDHDIERTKLKRASTHSMPESAGRREESSDRRRIRSRSLENLLRMQRPRRSRSSQHVESDTGLEAPQLARSERSRSCCQLKNDPSSDARSSRGRPVSRSLTDLYHAHDYKPIEDAQLLERRMYAGGQSYAAGASHHPAGAAHHPAGFHPDQPDRYDVGCMGDFECQECLYEEYLQFLRFRQSLRLVPMPCACCYETNEEQTQLRHVLSESHLVPTELSPMQHRCASLLSATKSDAERAPFNDNSRYRQASSPAWEYENPTYGDRSVDDVPSQAKSLFSALNASRTRAPSTYDCRYEPLDVQDALEKHAVTVKVSAYDTYV